MSAHDRGISACLLLDTQVNQIERIGSTLSSPSCSGARAAHSAGHPLSSSGSRSVRATRGLAGEPLFQAIADNWPLLSTATSGRRSRPASNADRD